MLLFLGGITIRAMQYMRVSLDFNEKNKTDDLSISVNILKELYFAQKKL